MGSFLIIALTFSLTISVFVEADHDGPHEGPTETVLNILFPACSPLDASMQSKFFELNKSGQINPKLCRNPSPGQEECIKKQLHTVRCAVNGTATEECINQVTSFLRGNTCSG
ncbi:hypothetical protein TNIN_500071 [Trichonephila inaurata madagascariensis]|uniref:Uncharacterized protein n=1 Tax=Trichonephila inaurata madagascariensis TaxID=2747483 RepID=A0A8X6XVC7_9ARAC|nr:hypothetical protein TNIN_500071 [Trichonephila inaurata madagascariensis]